MNGIFTQPFSRLPPAKSTSTEKSPTHGQSRAAVTAIPSPEYSPTVADLKYISLGGNQAWTWADPDPGIMFDDIAIYNKALTIDEIQADHGKKKKN